MEALDLAVGLGPVGPGPFGLDAELSAGVAPGVGAVAAAVVGEHPFDGDSVLGEPGNGASQDCDRGRGLFVGVELVKDRDTKEPAPEETAALVNGLRERRVLISATGRAANGLKIRPPLVFSKANADHFLSAMEETLAGIAPRA